MRTQIQSGPELTRLCQLIESIPLATLTHPGDEGALVSRPMPPLEMDGAGALWFFIDLTSAKVQHLHVVNLSFSDPARATHVSISGKGQIRSDRPMIAELWTPSALAWFPAGPTSPNLALLKIVPEAADAWEAAAAKMVRLLGIPSASARTANERQQQSNRVHDMLTALARPLVIPLDPRPSHSKASS